MDTEGKAKRPRERCHPSAARETNSVPPDQKANTKQTAVIARYVKMVARREKGTKCDRKIQSAQATERSPPSVSSKLDSTAVARPRLKRLPRLPVDDFKIVFRPSAGVDLAQYNGVELRAAVVAKSGLHSVVADEDIVCTNLAKNIFTVSTSCADRVANYAKVRELTLRGKKLGFHAYIAPPDGARAGIIYRAWNGESPQDLLQELRRANPLLPIVQARDMGRTSRSVLIHIMAEELPPSVKMFGILYAVFNFRPKVEACLNCRQVGHRRDVCPLPNRLTCSNCGQKHPEDYPCTPQCVICGDAHKTGDRACKQRFQRGFSRLSRSRQRPQQEHQQEQPEFQLEKEFFPSIDNEIVAAEARVLDETVAAEAGVLDETVAAKAKALDEVHHKAATSAPNPKRLGTRNTVLVIVKARNSPDTPGSSPAYKIYPELRKAAQCSSCQELGHRAVVFRNRRIFVRCPHSSKTLPHEQEAS
ncbi:hypothetical protein HPB51_026546 [Rhipicephalus microplus]|uniref:Tick transposon n=1 Tax=Rhipicephalus microplus TaxID=6941 RepID=A0A9J6D2S8_RHIMP|nr:hypothetical protein HPB51_026546 [Rhipicephalus microplus]